MTGARATTSVLTLAACLVFPGVLMAQSNQAGDVGLNDAGPAGSIHFNLVAQPLAQALHAYGRLAQLSVMAQTQLLEGRTSAPVTGDYPAHEALQRLLTGTGLLADFPSANEAIIMPVSPGQQPAASPYSAAIPVSSIDGALDDGDDVAYNAMIQTRLTQALCASAQTRPGNYRLVAQLRVGDTGSVVASKIIGSTGLPARDAAIGRAMQGLVLDSAPPAGLQQPVTILLRQQGNGIDTDCAQFDAAGE